jgi:uncharacterized protein (TIGR03084 family)
MRKETKGKRMADISSLTDDLSAEQDDLDVLVANLDADTWDVETPAPGWTVRHQIAHLTYFDRVAEMAITDQDAFAAERQAADEDAEAYSAGVLDGYLTLPPGKLLELWRGGRTALLDACRAASPGVRLPWFGPSMSPASMITARLMETWAHGQDVADAFHIRRAPTERIRHVIYIGYRARAYSYAMRGLTPPSADVRVEVTSPTGESWVFGGADAPDMIRGSALHLALVLTRRRHPDDTDLVATGPTAAEWLHIGQTFAGSPGPGRRAGQFPRSAV